MYIYVYLCTFMYNIYIVIIIKFQTIIFYLPQHLNNISNCPLTNGYATIWRETIRPDKFVGEPICRQANSSEKQFKTNKNNLPSLALKRQQQSFVMSLRQSQLFS